MAVIAVIAAVAGCARLLAIDEVGYLTNSSDGGGAAGVEDCENGIDDDGDGLVDCADLDCLHAGYSCESLGRDWASPAVIVKGDAGGLACPSGQPRTALHGLTEPTPAAATCGCTCAPPDAGCAGAGFAAADLKCAVYCGTPIANVPNGCLTLPSSFAAGCGGSPYYAPFFPVVDAGCEARATSRVPPAFAGAALVCTSDGPRGCAGGAVCMRRVPPAGSCLAAVSDVACPATHPLRTIVYDTGSVDTRDCTPCTCGPRQGAVCDGNVVLYADGSCTASPQNLGAHSCVPPSVSAGSIKLIGAPALVDGGACTPSGGQAIGRVDPIVAGTVCCAR